MDRTFHVYIVASRTHALYIGITSKIEQRIWEHKTGEHKGFSATYNCNRLVLLERFTNSTTAIAREKQLKSWTRAKKITLIEQTNPSWQDLSEGWYPPTS
jgi:putative endonuclease